MPTVGDTNIAGGTITPTIGATDVIVDLSNLIYEAVIREYLEPPTVPFAGWWGGASNDIVSVSSAVLTITPAHSTGSITILLDPYGINATQFRATIPSNANFSGSTGYTWSLSMSITHGTVTSGEVTRSYDTTNQIDGLGGNPVAAMTFTTEVSVPLKTTNPTPTDSASNVNLNTNQLSWDDGGGAETYDVYLGPTGNMTLRSFDQAGTTWNIPSGALSYNTNYEWRIDSINAQGLTTGDTWSFTTLVFAPPVPSGGGGGEHGSGEGGKNLMRTVRRLLVAAANKIYYEDE